MHKLSPNELEDAYHKFHQKSGAEKKSFLKTVTMSFEDLFGMPWCYPNIGYDFILKVWILEQLLEQAKDSPNRLVKIYHRSSRNDTKKKVANLLIEHFSEEDKAIAKDFSPVEIITIARFLKGRGLITDK